MKEKKFLYTLYLISAVIAVVIVIQAYWNFQNYKNFKRQILNDTQVSLDNSVESYYNNLAKKSTFSLSFKNNERQDFFTANGKWDTLIKGIDSAKDKSKFFDSISTLDLKGVKILKGVSDTILDNLKQHKLKVAIKDSSLFDNQTILHDSIKAKEFNILTSKIVISITNDTLSLQALDTILIKELQRKDLNIDYVLNFEDQHGEKSFYPEKDFSSAALQVNSNSDFLPKHSSLKLNFTNQNTVIFKKMLTGLLISSLLVFAVIGSLFYLLHIIRHQKQLAEIKNDLISNITHEFKTPIATISAAIEGIKSFNQENDPEKTSRYLQMSNEQLGKLNLMVEKLLETATLDSDKLQMEYETIHLNELLKSIVKQMDIGGQGKVISLEIPEESINIEGDVFHLENGIGNVLDNAIKYGGANISIILNKLEKFAQIEISDDGNTLKNDQLEAIFEKFYRVGEGNIHNVKGFGIGLYYTKKIVEKHNGSITVSKNNQQTTFNIKLPYV